MMFCLPFPPASLAGHNKGHWRNRDRVVATYRAEAFHLAKAAMRAKGYKVPEAGDIAIRFTLCPPHDRGDRVNYPIRLKPQIDGIAEALGVNDKRFLPEYVFLPPEKPGRVVVEFIPSGAAQGFTQPAEYVMEIGPETLVEQRPALTENRLARGGD